MLCTYPFAYLQAFCCFSGCLFVSLCMYQFPCQTINTLNLKVDTLEKAGANVGGGSGHSKQHYVTVTEVLKTRLLDVTKEFKDILMLRTEVRYQP